MASTNQQVTHLPSLLLSVCLLIFTQDIMAIPFLDKVEAVQGNWVDSTHGKALKLYLAENLVIERYEITANKIVITEQPDILSRAELDRMTVDKNQLTLDGNTYQKISKSLEVNPTPPGTALENLEAFSETLSNFYPFLLSRSPQWSQLVSEKKSNLVDHELFETMAECIEKIGDDRIALQTSLGNDNSIFKTFSLDSSFIESIEIERKKFNYSHTTKLEFQDFIEELTHRLLDLTAQRYLKQVSYNRSFEFQWGMLKHSPFVGYLNIPSMMQLSPQSLEADLDEIFLDFKKNKIHSLILDLRYSQGGQDWIALAIAKRVITKTKVAYLQQFAYGPGKLTPEKSMVINPHRDHLPDMQIAILTSPLTSDAAETLILSLYGIPNIIRIGTATMGHMSSTITRKLPNGWYLTLPNEIRSTESGTQFDKRGIPATMEAGFPFFTETHDPGIEQALNFFKNYFVKHPERSNTRFAYSHQ